MYDVLHYVVYRILLKSANSLTILNSLIVSNQAIAKFN